MVDVLNVIRTEKFDYVLPQAMRENNVDMWIQVMGANNVEEGNLDPLRLDLGGNTGYFIFTDRGGDRIERAAFSHVSGDVRSSGAYDIIRGRVSAKELGNFVAERDPERIAVNYSKWITIANGISHTDYLILVEALGDKYADRIVSAESVITAFRSRRVMSEIVFFGELCKETVEVIDKAFDIVEPGVTTLEDLARWLKNQNMSDGFGSVIQFGLPGVFRQDSDGNENVSDDYVIQRGDLVHIDFGLIRMNYRTDIKRIVYVLREGETGPPPEIEKIWDQTLEVREILRKNVKAGPTAGETLETLRRKIEESGYVFMEDEYDRTADPEKSQVFVDFHCLGHSWGDESVGPRIAVFAPDRAHLKIPAYHLFVIEFSLDMPMPEWGEGKHVYLAYEDDAIVTKRGVEYLYTPMKQLRVIR